MLKILEEYFRSKGDVEVVGSVSDGAQVMAAICQHSPDVLLLTSSCPAATAFPSWPTCARQRRKRAPK